MSFAISVIGSPTAIKQAMRKYSDGLTGASKDEFDAILPALGSLVDQHVGDHAAVWLNASGHATIEQSTGVRLYGTGEVGVRPLSGQLVYEDAPPQNTPVDDDLPF